jgi:WD40 repeat protein
MVVVWEAETGAILAILEGHGTKWVFSVAFSPDGQKLASGSSDPTVRVWRTEHTKFLFEINAHEDWIQSVAWSPDGRQLVSASDDNSLKFWDASTGDSIGQPCIGHTGWIYSLAISCDGSFIATASRDMTVRLWSTNTHQQVGQPIQHSDRVLCVAISPNGALIASGGLDREVFLWSVGDTLKLHDEQEGRKASEEANMEQQLRLIDLVSIYHSTSFHSNHESLIHICAELKQLLCALITRC